MDWHLRFVQQARWTQELRGYLFAQAGLVAAERVLEVGCGTGVILQDVSAVPIVCGLDLDFTRLAKARLFAPGTRLACGDALTLPFPTGKFDIVFCHYLLLWVRDPLQVLTEMKRVTRPGGSVLALAEPDHTGRVDEPVALSMLGRWQTEALLSQGADPGLGGRLDELFSRAGIALLETGSLQEAGRECLDPDGQALEWAVLESDLADRVPAARLRRLRAQDRAAWKAGTRRLFVPTYYAWGRV